jgi:SUN domain-containing protein 1/2
MFALGALIIAAIFFMISLSHEFLSPDFDSALLQSPNKIGITSWLSPHSWPRFTLVNRDELTIILEDLNRVKKELYLLRRDSVGIPDFALRHRGGHPINNLTTPSFDKAQNGPVTALDDLTQPGQCWRFVGSTGQLGVRLSQKVAIFSVTVDHVPRELVTSVQSAPKNMVLWGVSDIKSTMPELAKAGGGRRLPALDGGHDAFLVALASFRYDPHAASNIQTFSLREEVRYQVFDRVIFEVLDNWGAEFTCLYRVRVHGKPAA